MTTNPEGQWRSPSQVATLPSDYTIPADVPEAYSGAKVGLVREHAALGCTNCQQALDALETYLAENPSNHHDRGRSLSEPSPTGGGNHSITEFATDGGKE